MESTALTTILLKFMDSFTKARALIANTLAPLARKLHADVSSCCCYSFFSYLKRKMFVILNVIKEMISVRCATIELWMHLKNLLRIQQARVTLGYRPVRLFRFFLA